MTEFETTCYREARAKIMWGDKRDTVKEWLLKQGFSPFQSESFVRQCLDERHQELRASGLRKAIKNALISVLLLIITALLLTHSPTPIDQDSFELASLPGAYFLVSFYKTIDGLIRLLWPSLIREAITDLD